MSDNLRKEEQHGDAVRKQQMQEVDKERLKKAEGLLHRLTKDNSLINELVHHTVKVSLAECPAAPGRRRAAIHANSA